MKPLAWAWMLLFSFFTVNAASIELPSESPRTVIIFNPFRSTINFNVAAEGKPYGPTSLGAGSQNTWQVARPSGALLVKFITDVTEQNGTKRAVTHERRLSFGSRYNIGVNPMTGGYDIAELMEDKGSRQRGARSGAGR